jgi:hypothetical protein
MIDPNKLPGNSKRPERPAEDEKKFETLIENPAVSVKKPMSRRFMSVLFGNTRGVAEYLLIDVIVPQVKELIADMVTSGIERTLYGDVRSPRRPMNRGTPGPARTPYHQFAGRGNNPIGRSGQADRPAPDVRAKSMDDILFATRPEADMIHERLYDALRTYETVTVADLYACIGWSSTHIDHKWGWTSLEGSNVRSARGGGYILILPEPIYIND